MEENNRELEQYRRMYEEIRAAYLADVAACGVPLGEERRRGTADPSCFYKWKSPACAACRQGEESASYYLSLMCHRHCYYCFNPNQEHYEIFCRRENDAAAQLRDDYKRGRALSHIALTGGEPLLHPEKAAEFFRAARTLYPKAYLRLYTSGDLLREPQLRLLKECGLDEIRFSIKLEDDGARRELVCQNIALAARYLSKTMVEMPVIPGTRREMQALLLRLHEIGISGMNLLEFCFPFHHADEFKRRGFQIKNPPVRVVYDYDYAGGLPVSRSEELCLELLDFSERKKLGFGVHYCSFENKLTAQIYSQNRPFAEKLRRYFSPRDYFFKSIKVFGADAETAQEIFRQKKIGDFQINAQHRYLEFHPRRLRALQAAKGNPRVGIAYYVVEIREGEPCLREVHLEVRNLLDITRDSL